MTGSKTKSDLLREDGVPKQEVSQRRIFQERGKSVAVGLESFGRNKVKVIGE